MLAKELSPYEALRRGYFGGNEYQPNQAAWKDHQADWINLIRAAESRSTPDPVARPVPAKPSTASLAVLEVRDLDTERAALAVDVEDLLGYTPLRKDAGAPSKLERLLRVLEIDIYSDETVAAYKEKMRAHFQVKADNADRERIAKMRGNGRPTQTLVKWHMVALESYTKPVPEHVLRKCLQIKRAAPEATFHVDELREEKRTLDPFMVVQLGKDSAVIEVWDEPQFEE